MKRKIAEDTERKEQAEKLYGNICNWCSGGGPCDTGSGHFRDFDSDYGYGVDICGGCGGLGRIFETEDFKSRTKRIMGLRFRYCPTTGEFPLPPFIKLQRLEELIHEVKELFKIYGREDYNCFAQAISGDCLQYVIDNLKEEIKDQVETLLSLSQDKKLDVNASQLALVEAMRGNLKGADEAFRTALGKYPDSSLIAHDYAIFQLAYLQCSFQDMLPLLEKATQLEPKRALHFYNLALCLRALKQPDKALEILHKASECFDSILLSEEISELERII